MGLLVIYPALSLAAAALLFPRRRQAFRVARGSPFIWLFVAYATLSVLWSTLPGDSAGHALLLAGTTVSALYLACAFDSEELAVLLGCVLGVGALVSIVAALAAPSVAISISPGLVGWTGVYPQKNTFGCAMAFGLVVWPVLASDGRRAVRQLAWVFSALSLGLVVLSHSVTAMVATAAVLASWLLHAAGRLPGAGQRRAVRLATAVVFGLPALVLIGLWLARMAGGSTAAHVLDRVLTAIGRNATLTGRTKLWGLVLADAGQAPWLGWGFGGYWGGLGSPAASVWSALGSQPWSAHNGYLDVALQLGLIGCLLLAAILLPIVGSAVREAMKGVRTVAALPLAALAFILITDMAESFILEPTAMYWLVLVTVALRLNFRGGLAEDTGPSP